MDRAAGVRDVWAQTGSERMQGLNFWSQFGEHWKVLGREVPDSGVERGPCVGGVAPGPEQEGRQEGQDEAGAASRVS